MEYVNINERFRDELIEVADSLTGLKPGSEEHKRAVDELTKMYQLCLEHSKLDEEIMDRRNKMEQEREDRLKQMKDQIELEYSKMRHDRNTKLIAAGTVAGTTALGMVIENHGYIKPRIPEVFKLLKF